METLQYSTAAFEVPPIQLIAFTREILQQLELEFHGIATVMFGRVRSV